MRCSGCITMQAGEETVPSARDGAAHPGDSSQPQEAERRVRGQSGDSQGGFQEGVHELTGRDGAGRAEHQGVQMQRKSLHRAVPAAGIADIPDVPGWLPGTWASAAWGQPSGAGGSDVWSPPPAPVTFWPILGTRAPSRGKLRTSAQQGWEQEGFPVGMEGGRDGSAPAPQPPGLAAWGPRAATATPRPAPAGCSMGAILLPPPPRRRLVPLGEGAAAGARGRSGGRAAGPGAGCGTALGAKGSAWQGHGIIYMVTG